MPLVLADRVRDTTTTTGTGTVTLSGTAPTGYQNFSVIGNGNTTYYTINAGSQWEVGIGTYSSTGPTLARNTVLESSNANALVDFAAGVKDVFVTYPSDEAVYQDGATIAAGTAVLGVANGGTGVTTSTGTGSVVLSNSPTLVTPTLGAASATSIANGLGAVGTPSYTFTGDLNTGVWSPAADTIAFSEGGVEVMRIDSSANVGIGTSAPAARVHAVNSTLNAQFRLQDVVTDATNKFGVIGTGHFTNAQSPILAMGVSSLSASNTVFIGGGFGTLNAATAIQFYTAANNTTLTGTERMRIDSAGQVGIGGAASNGTTLRIGKNLTGATQGLGVYNNQVVQSDVTGGAQLFSTFPSTAAAAFTLGSLTHFSASQSTIGATSAVTNQYGFLAQSTLTGATNNYGFFSNIASGTGRWNFYAAGTAANYFEGNVGIGTTSPGTRLQVRDAAAPSGFSSTAVRVSRDNYGADFIGYIDQGVGHGAIISTVDNGTPTERMRINSAGNVGIGTSTPSERLDTGTGNTRTQALVVSGDQHLIYSAASTELGIRIGTGGPFYGIGTTGSSNMRINSASGGDMLFAIGGTERMRVVSGGNVGIGTSSPPAALSILRNSSTASVAASSSIVLTNKNTSINGTIAGGIFIDTYRDVADPHYSGGIWFTRNQTSGNLASGSDIVFGAQDNNSSNALPTEDMRITSAGNVGIGTSAPASLLHVKRGSNATEVYPTGTWATRVINATDASGENGLLVGNRWAGTGSTVFEAGSIFGGGTGSWRSFYRIDGVGNSIWANEGTERMRLDTSGNVGIGTSSPGKRLDVVGQFRVSGAAASGYALIEYGTSATASNNWHVGSEGDGTFRWYNGNFGAGTERMRITSAGSVGIGTSSPGERLDVAGGNIRIANNQNLMFRNAAGTSQARFLVQNDDNFVVYNAAGTPISSFTQGTNSFAVYGGNANNRMVVDSGSNINYWIVNGSERARINSSGEFLVGTTTGGRTVCIYSSDNWMRMHNPSRSWLIGPSIGSNFNIWDETGGYNVASFDTAGTFSVRNSIGLGSGVNLDNKIEIGAGRTGNNFAYIDLIGDTTYTDYGLRLIRGNGGPNTTSQLVHRGTGDMYITAQDAATLYIQTNNATRAYFQSDGTMVMNGALLVGRNSSGSNINTMNDTGSFSVRGDGSNAASMSFHRTGAFAINMGLGTDAVFRIGGWSASSNCFQMDASGNLTMLGNVTAYSDARIKKDVETIDSALDLVSKMRGVRFTRIDNDTKGVGVIAQEMLEVLPEVVQQGVGDDDTLSVAYGNLVGVLIEAVKELTARVAELERK